MNKNNLRKKLHYNDVIDKYQTFKISLPNRVASDILNNPIIENILSSTPEEVEEKIAMLDKATQKNYPLQNYDIFPDMYHIIDAQAIKYNSNYKDKTDKMVQTIRYILQEYSPSSSYSSSDKPPSDTPSDGSEPTPPPSPKPKAKVRPQPEAKPKAKPPGRRNPPDDSSSGSSIPTPLPTPIPTPIKGSPVATPHSSHPDEEEEEDVDGIGDMNYWDWLRNLVRVSPLPTPPRTPTPEGIPLTDEQIRARSRSHSSRNSSITGVASSWNSRQMRERSRSRSDNEGFTPSWSSRQLRERSRSRDS